MNLDKFEIGEDDYDVSTDILDLYGRILNFADRYGHYRIVDKAMDAVQPAMRDAIARLAVSNWLDQCAEEKDKEVAK